MRVHVDSEKCQGHNRCYALAPELFDVDDLAYAHRAATTASCPRGSKIGPAWPWPTAPSTPSRSRSEAMTGTDRAVTDWATDFDHTDAGVGRRSLPDLGRAAREVPGRAQRSLRRHVAARPPRGRRRRRVRHRALHVALGHRERGATGTTTTFPRRSASPRRSPPTRRSTRWPGGCCCRRSRPKSIAGARALHPRAVQRAARRHRGQATRSTPPSTTRSTSRCGSSPRCSASPKRTPTCSAASSAWCIEDVDVSAEERQAQIEDGELDDLHRRPHRRAPRRIRRTTSPRSCSKPRSTATSSTPTTCGARWCC